MPHTCLKEIMTANVRSIVVDEPFSHVQEKMHTFRIRHLPVVDHSEKVVGMITERDLYHTVSPRRTTSGDYYDKAELDRYHLKDIMTAHPLVFNRDDAVIQAVKAMAIHKYGAIPIVDGQNYLVGIVTQIDILKFIARRQLNL